jgi:hypothetical protein
MGALLGWTSGDWLTWMVVSLLVAILLCPTMWIAALYDAGNEPYASAGCGGAVIGGMVGTILAGIACYQAGHGFCWGGFLALAVALGISVIVSLGGCLVVLVLGNPKRKP